jgi:ubiquinone/menaquinone biosynthesis C-methylase UbiE
MLSRILEPEVMDSPEEAGDYDAMDHSTVNRLFVEDFLALWSGENPILDVGTGTGQIPIELCRQAATAQVVGIDLAWHMLALGNENVRRAGLANRLRLERCDAKQLPYPSASFAAVISNSIVHHIPEPAAVLVEMLRVLKPCGTLLVRDLLRPADDATLRQIVRTYAGDANTHQQQMFADSLHAALTLDEVRRLVADLGADPAQVRQTSDRHWTWAIKHPATTPPGCSQGA